LSAAVFQIRPSGDTTAGFRAEIIDGRASQQSRTTIGAQYAFQISNRRRLVTLHDIFDDAGNLRKSDTFIGGLSVSRSGLKWGISDKPSNKSTST